MADNKPPANLPPELAAKSKAAALETLNKPATPVALNAQKALATQQKFENNLPQQTLDSMNVTHLTPASYPARQDSQLSENFRAANLNLGDKTKE